MPGPWQHNRSGLPNKRNAYSTLPEILNTETLSAVRVC